GRGLAAASGAQALRRAGPAGQDPGPHRPHAQGRQAAAQLTDDDTGHQTMSKQIQDAYIVAATRTPVGKAPKGVFRNTRPAEILAPVLKAVDAEPPGLDTSRIDDASIGCGMPERERGMNAARIGVLLAGLPNTLAAQTINPFC